MPTPPPSTNKAHPQYEPKGFHALCLIDAPERLPSWYRTQWSRLMAWIRSPHGVCGLYAVGLLVGLLAVLGWHHVAFYSATNGLAPVSVYATRPIQIVDQEATRIKQVQAISTLAPHYLAKAPVDSQMHTALAERVQSLQQTFQARPVLELAAAQTRFYNLVGDSPEAKRTFERLQSHPNLLQDPFYWETIRMGSLATLDHLLDKGLTAKDYLEERNLLIDKAMPSALEPVPESRGLVHLLVRSVLRPNLVVDERAQKLAELRMEGQVKPIYRHYRKGERIVANGEAITDLHRQALRELGLAVDKTHWLGLLGTGLLALFFVATVWGVLYRSDGQRLFKPKYAGLVAALTLVTAGSFQVMQTVAHGLPVLWFPMAAYSLILSILVHPRIGFFATTLLVFLMVLTQHPDLESMAVLLLGSLAGTFALSRDPYFTDRQHLVGAMLTVSAANTLTVVALALINSPSLTGWLWGPLLWSIVASVGSGLLSGVLTVGLLPILESTFGLLSPYTLLELANHDQPLLRRLQFEAPGTFHHSLMLASLSEAAAKAIGANPLLTRVGCLYHDIGKMRRPLYFIENQSYFGSDNPHDRLPPRLSKRVIVAHTKDSIEMAQQHRLPEEIQAFMTEHHGTLMCGYFYQKALKEEGDQAGLTKDQFRYAGPKPQSRETAIAMLADAAESAVRALKTPSITQVEVLIDKLFRQRIDDGQFDECPITFQDLRVIRESFLRVLMGIQHERINYQDKMLKEFGVHKPAVGVTDPSLAGLPSDIVEDTQPSTSLSATTRASTLVVIDPSQSNPSPRPE
jgi:cyclic-di-AMP phosphodiesterase PgpH